MKDNDLDTGLDSGLKNSGLKNSSLKNSGGQADWTCPECGAALPSGRGCAAKCSQGSGCALVCCPECGKSFPHPERAGLAYRLSRWLGARGR